MPGRFFLTRPLAEMAQFCGRGATAVPDMPPRRNIQPGQDILVLTEPGFSVMRWGIVPVGRVNARGRPVMETIINARGETLFDKSAFHGTGRAVIPVDGWYEWTGKTRRKTAWRISQDTPLLFAAITDVWTAPGGQALPQVAAVTCAPNQDVKDIHHRMGVLLEPADIDIWLTGSARDAQALIQPWPEGRLTIETADNVDWSAA
ncbi:SOS response-associated peptidase [Cognatishimia sp. SS12]|uniref:SOS response-associated peptidase n=1 Tax=Cognatishimia sp. SS12 TaxID=2979465 RepID=UPI0023304E8F|nr:SOS response-associated peptidase [Cognatishimia sp. SS12]MDC0738969.1 SOS response-associated peptidase [Cognatishimia sp. SS12]